MRDNIFKKFLSSIFFFYYILSCFISSAAYTEEESCSNKLCLTMIVRNESKIIERCLNSVKDIVDCVSICDTGSNDETVALIEAFLNAHQIPGKVYRHEWKNFGYNRTLSAEAAQETLKELGLPLQNTFLLLLDADMMLKINPEFDKQQLFLDEYLLVQKSDYCSHYNTRLVRASLPWKCLGVTHEYWSCEKKNSKNILTSLWIDDRNDGGCKTDKFERDISLLKQGLRDEPDNVRYMFYLAQSYKCVKEYDLAIKWYKERVSRKGWYEEVWYSKLMIGDILETLGDWDQALMWYLDAYQSHPTRAEPLERITSHFRQKGQHHLAYIFAIQGKKVPYPSKDLLFVEDSVYNYRFDEELSISAFYTPFKNEGFEAIENLAMNRKAPSYAKYQAANNLRFYTAPLKNVHLKSLPVTPPMVNDKTQLRMNPTNPSIVKTEQGFLVLCRCVNYTQEGAQNYQMIDPTEGDKIIVRTRNFLLDYDKNFNLISQKEMIDNLSFSKKYLPHTMIEGLEDGRIFALNDTYWVTCTTQDMTPYHVPQIGLCKLDIPTNNDHVSVEHFIPLRGPDPTRCEKNWLPFIKDGEIHAIYSYDPLVINKINSETGECQQVISYVPSKDYSHFRGSAGPIPFDDGYLVVVHHVGYDNGRYYYHRFLQLDKNYSITNISRPFTFQNQRVEFCCGMTLDHGEKNLIMTVGIEDRQALIATVDVETVRLLLKPELPLHP